MKTDARLIDIAGSIADGLPVDWTSVSQTLRSDDERRLLTELKYIAESIQPRRTLANDSHWGPLRIIERIGGGKFGDVYRAWDRRLDREVALKILQSKQLIEETDSSAIIEEGRLLAKVHHPNVVTVYGAERIDGQVGVWMEFIHGETLESELEDRGPFSEAELLELGIQLADALIAVHRAGVIHRDIKAQNVLRDQANRVLLADFGAGVGPAELAANHQAELVGTPLYVAPEVLAGGDATSQSDIYSLGVLVFHLATGEYPVVGQSLAEVHRAHAKGNRRRLIDARPDLPKALCDLIDQTLEPAPRHRIDGAESLLAGLIAVKGLSEREVAPRANGRGARSHAIVAGIAASLLVAAAAGFHYWPRPEAPIIAVLPLKNLTPDRASGDFVDGLTSEIIRELASVRGLSVRSQSSSFAFKDKPRNLREISRLLGANLVIEGSVQRSDNRVRIIAQLVRVSDQTALWSQRFDRESSDILAIQDEISRSIVNQLRLTLGTGPRRYDTDGDTYEHYLRARSLVEHKDPASLKAAIELFQYVITRDPGFAPAYAGMAWARADLVIVDGTQSVDQAYTEIAKAAFKAAELDPMLPEAHAAIAVVHSRNREWPLARQSFERAITLNPSLSWTRVGYAYWTLMQIGQLKEALGQLDLALRSDPLSLDVRRVRALVNLLAGQYTQTIEDCQHVMDRDPKFPFVSVTSAAALWFSGQTDKADTLLTEQPRSAIRAFVLGKQNPAAAITEFANSSDPVVKATLAASMNNVEGVMGVLTQLSATRDPRVASLSLMPQFRAFRTDPRFVEFQRSLGMMPD
jgi:serine/threonine protein kinase